MSEVEYDDFIKTGNVPRTNVLTKGPEGYMKQANVGGLYVEFDIDSSLLIEKNAELGWSMIKSKNTMYQKLAQRNGYVLPPPIGDNIMHIATKFRY